MKALKIIMASFILMVALQISDSISSVEASDYLGDVCWSFHKTEDDHGSTDETYLTRIGVTHMGGSYCILQGIIEVPDDNRFILDGTAVIIGNEVFITMNGSQDHSPDPWRDTDIIQMRLNLSTLNGTFWGNRLDFNTSTREFDHGYAAGTATLTTCP